MLQMSTRGTHMRSMRPSADQAGRDESERAGTTIGNRVWIGYGAIIVDGVTVGDGAVVGAGSLVTDDVPPGITVRGAPARPSPSFRPDANTSLCRRPVRSAALVCRAAERRTGWLAAVPTRLTI